MTQKVCKLRFRDFAAIFEQTFFKHDITHQAERQNRFYHSFVNFFHFDMIQSKMIDKLMSLLEFTAARLVG